MNWVKTEDKLPEAGVLILGYFPDHLDDIAILYRTDDEDWYSLDANKLVIPTYWTYIERPR